MAAKVVHLTAEVHSKAKAYCRDNGIGMKEWVSSLVTRALSTSPLVPVERAPKIEPPPEINLDVSEPPFWDRRQLKE